MDELLEQFLIEGRELVQQAGDDLLALERRPADPTLIDSVFRAVHTLKGSVVLFDLAPMGLVLHAAEDLLGAMRSGKTHADQAAVDALFAVIEQTGRWLALIAEKASLPETALTAAQQLAAAVRARLGGAGKPAAPVPVKEAAWADELLASCRRDALVGRSKLVAVRYVAERASFFNGYDPIQIVKAVPEMIFLRIDQPEKPIDPVYYDPFECNLAIELVSSSSMSEVKAAFRFVADQVEIVEVQVKPATETQELSALEVGLEETVSRTLRVDTTRIDTLAEIADELVIAKNALGRLAADAAAGMDARALIEALNSRQALLDRTVRRLHRTVTSLRLVPLAPLLRRFSRLVRELARNLGKEVELTIEEQGIEADKSIVDGLFDPLTHLIRNALDHGIETTVERQRAGKPERAHLRLSVGSEGNHIIVEVRDDGRGMDPTVIRRVAAERAILDKDALEALSDDETLDLIFTPGFSTAGRVTDISGRGVGMDAVRAAVGKLGGKVSLSSSLGLGTTVRLSLPMNVALTPVVVVTCAGERYGIPMDAIVETAKIAPQQITPIRSGRAVVLRDRAMPLLALASLLGLVQETPSDGVQKALVIRIGEDLVAIGVDAFLDRTELLLRPLTGLLSGMRGVAGTALLGDGQVMMVIEPAELIG